MGTVACPLATHSTSMLEEASPHLIAASGRAAGPALLLLITPHPPTPEDRLAFAGARDDCQHVHFAYALAANLPLGSLSLSSEKLPAVALLSPTHTNVWHARYNASWRSSLTQHSVVAMCKGAVASDIEDFVTLPKHS